MATPKQTDAAASSGWRDEQNQFGDIVFLQMNESRFMCAIKPLLWYQYCLKAFPTARFIAISDDDAYLQLDHLEADLRSLQDDAAERLILWGLVMWYGAYDNVTMVTHETWGGWSYNDGGAVKSRRRMEECRDYRWIAQAGRRLGTREPSRRRRSRFARSKGETRDPCRRLTSAAKATIDRAGLSDRSPWPVVNGPLFAVSRRLAQLVVENTIPRQYLKALHQTERVRNALSRPGGPRKSNFGCWPVADSIFGLWITQISETLNIGIELVNSPFMVQHHPWPATVHGAFSNSSIVLHGLKKEKNQRKFREVVMQRGMGAFVPFRRHCGNCASLGWSTWGASVHSRLWTCCGCDATASKRDCDERMSQV